MSPVIAVILMVAITVVLAATVYVWVSGFANEDSGPESASATARGMDLDGDGNTDWVRITLVRGENAPYEVSDVTISAVDPSGAAITTVCENATFSASACDGATEDEWGEDPAESGTDSWDVGETLWLACANTASGDSVAVTASVKGTAILDAVVECDEDAS